ncbi:hypothetical protein GCK32_020080, partial [Trichostrongylus colubriformis]
DSSVTDQRSEWIGYSSGAFGKQPYHINNLSGQYCYIPEISRRRMAVSFSPVEVTRSDIISSCQLPHLSRKILSVASSEYFATMHQTILFHRSSSYRIMIDCSNQ